MRCIKRGDQSTFQSVSAAQYRVSNFFIQNFKYFSINAVLGLNMALYWVVYPWINSNFIANVLRCFKAGDLNTFQSVSAAQYRVSEFFMHYFNYFWNDTSLGQPGSSKRQLVWHFRMQSEESHFINAFLTSKTLLCLFKTVQNCLQFIK